MEAFRNILRKVQNPREILRFTQDDKFKKAFIVTVLTLCSASSVFAADKIKITATTPVFAGIAEEITEGQADIYYVASPNRDVHFISPTPKDILKVKRADIFVHGGLDLEVWRGPLLDAAGRLDFMGEDSARSIDVSRGVTLKEIPESLSRLHGDVHAFGNPHYWTDPLNAKAIAGNIARGLSEVYPDRKDFFTANLEKFNKKLDEGMSRWENQLAPYKGNGVVVYHNSWPYFLERFGLSTVEHLEPKPGIAPTPKHLQKVIQLIKERNVKVIIKESFQDSGTPRKVANSTGAQVITLHQEPAQAVSGGYIKMMDENISTLAKALGGSKAA